MGIIRCTYSYLFTAFSALLIQKWTSSSSSLFWLSLLLRRKDAVERKSSSRIRRLVGSSTLQSRNARRKQNWSASNLFDYSYLSWHQARTCRVATLGRGLGSSYSRTRSTYLRWDAIIIAETQAISITNSVLLIPKSSMKMETSFLVAKSLSSHAIRKIRYMINW